MPGPDGSVYLNSDMLDCETCRAMTDAEHKWLMLSAALFNEENHMATHMIFGIEHAKARRTRKARKP